MVWSERHLFAICVAFRTINSLLVRTWFVPDEYYQSLEPAHRLAFGYGHLTWEWRQGLRSYVYPLVLAGIYLLLRVLHLDTRSLVVFSPKLFQSVLGALGDIHLYKVSKRLFGEHVAFWTLCSYWVSWFGFFCTPRTLANSVETVLTLVGLYHYAWPNNCVFDPENLKERQRKKHRGSDEWIYMSAACLATIVRPTAALFWVPLCLWHLWRVPRKLFFLLRTCLPIGAPMLILAVYVDRLCYGKWLISLWNFAKFNVLEGGSAHFGSHPWHWYWSQGIPTVFTVHLLPVSFGVAKTRKKVILWLCLWYVLFHSTLAHKEHRFLLPLVPLLCIYSGVALSDWAQLRGKDKRQLQRKMNNASLEDYWGLANNRAKLILLFMLVVNLPVALYTGLIHQVGAMDLTRVIHEEVRTRRNEVSVWFLTPCCSTPFYSHVHSRISMRFLNCDPNLNHSLNYVDEADLFHENPERWVQENLPVNARVDWPTHLVLYDIMWARLEPQLGDRNFTVFKRLFNAHFPQSSRQSSYFVLTRRIN